MKRIIIIGAGVVGSLLAREWMQYRDVSVTVLEQAGDVAMGATKANSAIVHAGFDAVPGSLKAKLNVEGSRLMASLCRELEVKYNPIGALVVGFSEEDKKTLAELKARGEANGVEGLQVLEKGQPGPDWRNIGDGVTAALWAPTSAIVCPYELCIAAMGNAMDNGAALRLNTKAVAIREDAEGYAVETQQMVTGACETLHAEIVINCAGIHSDEVARMAGDDTFTITPRRGEYMLLDKGTGSLIAHTVFRCPGPMGKGILVSPTADNNLLLGPTAADQEEKDYKETSREGLTAVREKAAQQVNNIPFRSVITSFAGLRATGSTGDFIINCKAHGRKNQSAFVNVAAIESPGLSASPAIAKYVIGLLCENGAAPVRRPVFDGYAEVKTDETAYSGRRKSNHWYRNLSEQEKNEQIKRDPAFGRIVCRCETVTEGEIVDAIRRNPGACDVDGVKRRTRSGMGRCQGGFCGPHVAEILAREQHIPFTEVTKFGGASWINTEEIK